MFQGEQMIPIINKFGIDVACFGNHEFDYGTNHLCKLFSEISPPFPWILSNLKIEVNESNNEHCNLLFSNNEYSVLKEYIIKEYGDIKIGIMGLVESEWISSCPSFNSMKYSYTDFNKTAEYLIDLFEKENCDLIIALTHMRENNNM